MNLINLLKPVKTVVLPIKCTIILQKQLFEYNLLKTKSNTHEFPKS